MISGSQASLKNNWMCKNYFHISFLWNLLRKNRFLERNGFLDSLNRFLGRNGFLERKKIFI
jgi:hypothetical protein